MSEIYLIQESMNGPIKIGRSISTAKRIQTLQTGNPRALRAVQVFTVSAEDAVEAERCLHEELANRRLCGEWFDVSEEFMTEYMPDFFRSIGVEYVEGEIA